MSPSSNQIMASSTIISPNVDHAVTFPSPSAAAATEFSIIATAADYSATTNTSTTIVPSSPTNAFTPITYVSAAAPTRLNDSAAITQPIMSPGTSTDTSRTSVTLAPEIINPIITEPITTLPTDMDYSIDIWLAQSREEGAIRWFWR